MKADPSRYLEFRRDIHRHPELSNQEVETTRRIREFLARDGLELCPIGALNGGFVRINAGKARTLCMRADIDALPLTEHTGAPFSSVHEGVMHACGHDMHTAIAAGIACELNRVKDRLNCNILVLFQPAEEANPVGGARPVTEAGFLTDQHIDEMYGLHMWPSLPVGTSSCGPAPLWRPPTASASRCWALPPMRRSPTWGWTPLSSAPRSTVPWSRSSGGRSIPSSPSPSLSAPSRPLGATMWSVTGPSWTERSRTTSEESRNYLHRRIREIPQQIASLYGGQAKVDIQAGYGVLRNSPELFQRFSTHAARLLGQEHVHTDIHPSLIGEDFYYFSHQVPSLYFHIGCQAEHPLHNDAFLPREEVLGVAIDLMTDYFLAQA